MRTLLPGAITDSSSPSPMGSSRSTVRTAACRCSRRSSMPPNARVSSSATCAPAQVTAPVIAAAGVLCAAHARWSAIMKSAASVIIAVMKLSMPSAKSSMQHSTVCTANIPLPARLSLSRSHSTSVSSAAACAPV